MFLESVILELQTLWWSSFVSQCLKCNLDFKNASKNWQNSFWDNFIWISIVKLPLLRTGHFSSTANELTSSPKIWHVNKRNFFQLNWRGSDQWIWYWWFDEDLNSACARLPCCLSIFSLKWDFLGIYLTTFSQSVIRAMQNLWGSSFYSKCLKFNLDFKNVAKIWEKVFFSEITETELVFLNGPYEEQDTFHRQPMC